MKFETHAALLAAVISLALALSMLIGKDASGRRLKGRRLFLAICTCFFLWNFGSFLNRISGRGGWIAGISGWGLPLLAAATVEGIVGVGKRPTWRRWRKTLWRLLFLWSLLFAWPVLQGRLTRSMEFFVEAAYALPPVVMALSLLFWRTRVTPFASDRLRFRVLGHGALAVAIFLFLPSLRPLGRMAGAFYLFLLAQLVLHEPRRSPYEVVVRGIVFLILIVVMATIFMVLVLGIGGDPRFFVVNTLVASGVILVLYEPVKDLVAHLVTRALLKEQLALEKLLGRLSEGMIGRIELDDLLCFVTETLCATPRFVGTAVYLAEEERNFRRVAAAGERKRFAAHFPSGELLSWILQHQQPIFLESSGTELPPEVLSKLTQGMAGIDAQILIPLIGKGGLLGLWAIALRPSVEETSSVEERLLLTIANQLAIGIENCRIYARMREQDQLATLGEMAAVLAHEIRNPLGAVKGAAQYLQPSLEDFQARDFLQIIIDETNRLNNVVSHFLDYAKPLTLQCVPCDVNELLRKTLVVALEGRSVPVRVVWELDDAIVPIPLDVERMQGVILNLLLNAIEAMPEGGTLTIRTRQDGGTRIEIEDSGCGIPPEVRGKIFRPFFTTKVSGSGLGLAICQRIVTHHGGRIELESAPGEGTCVRLSFPIAAEACMP